MSEKLPTKTRAIARSRARRRALQALYAWFIAKNPLSTIITQFEQEQEMAIADIAYFKDILLGIEKHQGILESQLHPFLDRSIARLDPIEHAVLLIAAYELVHRIDVPYPVVLNEAIEMTKRFGADSAHTFVNGVLDPMAAKLRAIEYKNKS